MQYGLENFQMTPGRNCFYGSLYNIYRYYNDDMTEADLYFLCRGYDCQFKDDPNFLNKPHHSIQFSSYIDQIYTLQDTLKNLYFQDFQKGSLQEFTKNVFYSLERSTPLIVMVRPDVLDYQPVQIALNRNYHCIVVLGIDSNGSLLLIGDPYVLMENGDIASSITEIECSRLHDKMIHYASLSFLRLETARSVVRSFAPTNTSIREMLTDSFAPVHRSMEYLLKYAEQRGDLTRSDIYKYIYILKARFLCQYDYILSRLNAEALSDKQKINRIKTLKSDWERTLLKLILFQQYGFAPHYAEKIWKEAQTILTRHRQMVADSMQ